MKKTLKKKQRQLSPHVVSRVYRSPEIILMQDTYDSSSDIWSLGCVLAELIHVSIPNVEAVDALPR